GVAQLQLEVGDARREIRIPAALAVTVHAALDVRRAGLNRGDTVRDRGIGVVMGVNADYAVEALAHFRNDLHQTRREGAPVGIAETEHVRARALRGFERLQRIIGIVD